MVEIKRHPYTSVTALACLLAIPVMYSLKADASDVKALAAQISEVRDTVRRESTVGQLDSVRRELFDINLRIAALERENTAVDVLLYKRRDELLAQQRRLESLIQAMDAKTQ